MLIFILSIRLWIIYLVGNKQPPGTHIVIIGTLVRLDEKHTFIESNLGL